MMTAIPRTDVDVSSTQTLTGKTLTSPVINTPTGITKTDVGLGNVDNTSDATKNAATATLTNKSLTNPKINALYSVTNSAAVAALSAFGGAVNYFGMVATSSGTAPYITATGSDSNVDFNLKTTGSGVVQANGNPVGVKVAVPASASATGVVGHWAADTSWIYVCTAANTWVRGALATW